MPVQDVVRWPDAVVSLYDEQLSREPAPVERLEYAIAQLTALTFNANSSGPPKSTTDFLLFARAWDAPRDLASEQFDSLERRRNELG